jgi:hypothetical protein
LYYDNLIFEAVDSLTLTVTVHHVSEITKVGNLKDVLYYDNLIFEAVDS